MLSLQQMTLGSAVVTATLFLPLCVSQGENDIFLGRGDYKDLHQTNMF